jgi:hypothetical protein
MKCPNAMHAEKTSALANCLRVFLAQNVEMHVSGAVRVAKENPRNTNVLLVVIKENNWEIC